MNKLECDLPAILGRHYRCLTPADLPAFRRVQRVLMDVRWNYGPPTEVHVVAPEDLEEQGDE